MNYKVGDTVCGCRLLQQCGEGAYGTVFLAEDSVGIKVAVKIICKSGRVSDREISGLINYSKCCNHRNLLKIGVINQDDTSYFYTMDAADDLNGGKGEYLPDTLANRLNQRKRLEGKEVAAMLEGLLDGLEELHRKGLVHRDIKPDNILWVKGCPTLADVGLITKEGEGTIVGTPGFMSEELFQGKRKAEASDDFYALGKVIYCALTGNPVEKYAKFPEDMTISIDANLGRAYREPCSRPIHSSAEFRKLLTGSAPRPQQKPEAANPPQVIVESRHGKTWLWAGIFAVLLAAVVLLWNRTPPPAKQLEAAPVPESQPPTAIKAQPDAAPMPEPQKPAVKQPEASPAQKPQAPGGTHPELIIEPNGNTRLKRTGTEDPEYMADLQQRVQAFLDAIGYFEVDRLQILLRCRPMTSAEIIERLNYSNENPRLNSPGVPRHTPKVNTPEENQLIGLFNEIVYPPMEQQKLQERQAYWRKQPGTPLAVQQKMLKTDLLMQAAALDLFIRQVADVFLTRGRMTAADETHLKEIIELRQELLDPEFGQVLYLGRKKYR